MSGTFDPYLTWLGIRDPRRPPHHYRLLGLEAFESDPDVIESAADRQMAHVRTFQAGKYSRQSQKLLNELSSAKICLLNPQKKAQYDARLKAELDTEQAVPEAVLLTPAQPVAQPTRAAAPAPAAFPQAAMPAAPEVSMVEDRLRRRKSSSRLMTGTVLVLGVFFAGIGAAYFLFSGGSEAEEEPIQVVEKEPQPKSTDVDPNETPKKEEPAEKTPEPKEKTPEPKNEEPPPQGQLAAIQAHQGAVMATALAPSGGLAVSGGVDNRLRVWDVESGETAGELEGHTGQILKVGFSADGTKIVSGSEDRTIRVWDLILRKQLSKVDLNRGAVCLDWALAAHRAVTGDRDGSLQLWDLETGESLFTLSGHLGPVTAVALSPSATLAASASADGTLRVWNLESQEAQYRFDISGTKVRTLAFSPDGKRLVYGTAEHAVQVVDTQTGEPLTPLELAEGAVTAVRFSVSGQRILTAADNGSVKLWNMSPPEAVKSFTLPRSVAVSLAFSSDGKSALTGADDGRLRLWELPAPPEPEVPPTAEELTFGLLREFTGHNDAVQAAAFSPDGKLCATAGADRSIHVYQTESGELVRQLDGHDAAVTSVAFVSPDSLLSGSADGGLLLWKLGESAEPVRLPNVTSVVAVAVDPESGKGVSADTARVVNFWDLASQTSLGKVTGGAPFDHWDFDSRVQTAASGGYDRTLRVWNLTLGTALASFPVPGPCVSAVAISDEGTRAASADLNGLVRVWDVPDKREAIRLSGPKGPVWAIDFAPDGKQLICGGQDHAVHVFDLESGRSAVTLQGHMAVVTCVTYSRDGKLVLSGDRAGVARLWRLPPREPLPSRPEAFVNANRKLPEPAKTEVAQYIELLRKDHKDEYGTRRQPAERAAFTGRLLAEAAVNEDALARFALLSEARDVAASNGDVPQAMEASHRLTDAFELDRLELMSDTFTALLRNTRSPAASLAVVRAAVAEAEQLAEKDQYADALKLAGIASRASRAAKSPPLTAYTNYEEKQLRTFKTEFDRHSSAVSQLNKDSIDPAANAELGKFHCFWRMDWQRGLPMLALGDDEALATLARDELRVPTNPDTLFDIGRRWLEAANEEPKLALRTAYEVRAYESFRRAAKDAAGLTAERIRLQLVDVTKTLAPKVGQYLSNMPESEVIVGHGVFGKAGRLGYAAPNGQQRILVRGQLSPHGLSMYPPGNGGSHVAYALFGEFVTFQAAAAIADSASQAEINGLTFKVLGDGKLLWQATLSERSQMATCTVNVRGVEKLELVVVCSANDNTGCQAVWVEPSLWRIELQK